MSEDLLKVQGLHISYGAVQAVQGVSFEVPLGRTVCLIGANGAGKSSILRALSGLIPAQGQLSFKGSSLQGVPAHVRVKQGLVHCPEGRGVFPEMSVRENLQLGAYTRTDPGAVGKDLDHVLGLFPRLAERLPQAAGTLSGGEQQMLAMGRALMARPQLLMLDEPSLGLAPQVVEMIMETVQAICRQGVSVLLVEQNASLALEISHHAYVLETGQVVLQGEAAAVANDERVKKAYLGG
jgi:branched-chain amino acid transport system ATP-binding protein